jgi:quercetin dioxygenase-like cupin family protein
MPELSDAWFDGDDSARWRSAAVTGPGTGARASGSSLLEVDPGCRLPRHTDSAEESIVLIQGEAEVTIGDETKTARAGDILLVPECVPHEVRNAGADVLRFAAVYAANDVTTTYDRPVQPDGEAERSSVA